MKILHTARARTLALLVALVAIFAIGLISQAALGATKDDPGVFSPTAQPYGQSYSEWAADWWQWALSQPAATNPQLDKKGTYCAEGQQGRVWFLAGSFSSKPVKRSCTVPQGKALLFPVLNLGYFAFPACKQEPPEPNCDPPANRTEAFVRSQVTAVENPTALSATIDGIAVPNLSRYLEKSVIFAVVLPADNIFGLPAGFVLDPSVDAGYYLMVKPLDPGMHTIHFEGAFSGFSVDVTYQLTVVG